MHLDIISIGNSQGIRLPKALIAQCGFGKTVEVEVVDHQLIIKNVNAPRKKWANAFMEMAAHKDDALLDASDRTQEWDQKEWEW